MSKSPRIRKPYRQVRVFDSQAPHGVNPRLVLRIWPNGLIEISELRRKVRYETQASAIYVSCILSSIRRKKADKKSARKLKSR